MQAHIFAEGSNTTGEDRDQLVKNYYEGLFDMVAGLEEELAELANTHLHVLSEEYGVASGEETMSAVHTSEQNSVGNDVMVDQVRAELFDAVAER